MLLITCQKCTVLEHLPKYMKCKILEIVCALLLCPIEGFEYWDRYLMILKLLQVRRLNYTIKKAHCVGLSIVSCRTGRSTEINH